MKWVVDVIAALLILLVICSLGAMLVVSVRQENACWRAGYEMPVNYGGTYYCFGREGRPEVVALAAVDTVE